ncbi:MAG: haloacid dehalogenase-like hydrolase [Lachnospiraceae bacterium]
MEAFKKWKTIAIASILVAVISLGGLCYTVVRSGSAKTGTQAAPTTEQTAAAGEQAATGEQTAAAEQTSAETQVKAVDANEMLSLWNEGAPAREALTAYMEAITKEGSPDFIPVENRIAVFDFDGTLFCETDPNYFDYTLLVYRVTEDPEYKDRASEFEKMVAAKIIDQNTNGTKYAELPVEHGQAVASAFKGMTMREFLDYIQEFKKQPMPSYEGMTRGGGFYEPMLQIINYLKANDFTVYVISGTDRFICRGIMENSPLELPNSQIIGSDETVVAGLQDGADGLDYTFTQGDDLYLGGEFIIKNLKMNKVTVINSEIGVQPVLSFGNTTGDAAMCNYALSNNPYKSLAFMLCCDDLERENGNIKKANDMYKLCEENNWIPVSMKNDWKTIYAEGVKYIGKQAEEPAAEPAAVEQPAEQPATEEPAAEQPAAEEQPATEEPAEEQQEVLDNAA